MAKRGWYIPLIIFCSPLYFAFRGRWIAMILNGILWILALATLVFGVGILFWLIAMVHGYWDFSMLVRDDGYKRQAELIAKESGKASQS